MDGVRREVHVIHEAGPRVALARNLKNALRALVDLAQHGRGRALREPQHVDGAQLLGGHAEVARPRRALLRKIMPVARRVLGESNHTTLCMRWIYAKVLIRNDGATLDHLHEAVNTLEEIEPSARRVFGGAEPLTMVIERDLRDARAALRARESPLPGRA